MPEIQAHAERLTADYRGSILERFRPLSFVALKTALPSPTEAEGRPLDQVGRRGKYLLATFGDRTFVIHLMQGGRLKPDPKQSPKPRGGVARWRFTDERAWLLSEAGTEHKVGVWMAAGDPATSDVFAHLGPEANELDQAGWAAVLASHPMRLHGLLRDQRAVAGLGRRLANEICWAGKLSPFANAAKLKDAEVERLTAAVGSCLSESLQYERSRPDMSSSADRPGGVHHRTGETCPDCGDAVRAVEYRAYTVNYCPTCQTGGKVLADNTTSKFLR